MTEPESQNESEKLRREVLNVQLAAAVNQYQSVNRVVWTIFSIFAAAHAVLVNALFQNSVRRPMASVMLSGLGLFAAIVWVLLLRRTIGHLRWHQALVSRIEISLKIEPEHQIFPARDPDAEKELPTLGYGPPAKLVMQVCTWIVLVAWLSALVYFIRETGRLA